MGFASPGTSDQHSGREVAGVMRLFAGNTVGEKFDVGSLLGLEMFAILSIGTADVVTNREERKQKIKFIENIGAPSAVSDFDM